VVNQAQNNNQAKGGGFRFSSVMLLLFVGGFVVQALLPSSNQAGRVLYFLSLVGPCFLALYWGIATGRLMSSEHKKAATAWILIGVGTGLCGFGEFFYNFPEMIGAKEPNSAKWIDVLFLSSYLFQAAGLLLLSPPQSVRAKARIAIDSGTIAVASAFFLWTFLIKKTALDPTISQADRVSAVLYPVFGLIVVWAALKLFTEKTLLGHSVKTSGLALLGITTYVGSDIYWSFLEANANYATGKFGDIGWPIGYGLVAFAAMIAFSMKPRSLSGDHAAGGQNLTKAVSYLIPVVAFSTTIIVAWGDFEAHGAVSVLSLTALLGMSVLISARQIVSLLESQDTIREINEDLEQRIQTRTLELEDRVKMVVAITHASDLDAACELATEAVRHFTSAPGCGVHVQAGPGEDRPFGRLHWLGEYKSGFKTYALIEVEPVQDSLDPVYLYSEVIDRKEIHFASFPLQGSAECFGSVIIAFGENPGSKEDIACIQAFSTDLSSALGQLVLSLQAIASSELDYLTGLLNHRAISRRFHKICENSRDSQTKFGILSIDIANFKTFNETYGHIVGDELLRRVGRELRYALGPAVSIGRTGGDEFMILVPNANLSQTYKIARLVNDTIVNSSVIPDGHAENIPIAVHIGLASYPESGSNPYVVLTKADGNLADAKRANFAISEEQVETKESKKYLADDTVEIIEMFVTAIDNMDSYTRRHSEDVMKYAVWIGEELEASPDVLRIIATSALLHDIGKIAVPSSILQKPAALNDKEQEVARQHPYIGSLIVQALPGMAETVDGVLHHHEHFDGTGYPFGLAGKEIPFLGRLLAVADAYSAMTTDRPYRRGLDPNVAVGRILEGRGKQFDPEFLDAMISALVRRGICDDPMEQQERKAA
jgi:diguanylate cyclase (GGDEF)-like protein